MTEAKRSLIKQAINLINEAIRTETSLNKLCVQKGKNRNLVTNLVWEINNKRIISEDVVDNNLITEVIRIYDNYLKLKDGLRRENKTLEKPLEYDSMTEEEKLEVSYDAYDDDSYDERSYGEAVRDGEEITLFNGIKSKRIESYYYHIKVKGKRDLIGELTREEMNMVYRLYSNMDGAGLTQRVVSRHFPNLSFHDFKRILRAFNITKSSHPVAPHIIEEGTLDEVVDLIYRNKENNLFKKIEQDRGKQTEKLLIETQKQLVDLKAKFSDWKEILNDVIVNDITPFKIKKQVVDKENALVVYLSDMHVGAKTEDSIYQNEYNEKEFNKRLESVITEIANQYDKFGRFDKIVICNLGDSLDGYNGQTTRGGHQLPQNMDNRGQYNVYNIGMKRFFDTLHELDLANNINYLCVGDSNHDGDFGYFANKALEVYLNLVYPDMEVRIFEKFIETFEYGDHMFILSHGKDKEDKKHGFPLNLDNKTENYLNDFIFNNDINNKYCHVVSGDLHQTSINYGKRFRYKKVSSLYGSSKWIHNNFGNTKAAIDYEIVAKRGGGILEGRIVLS